MDKTKPASEMWISKAFLQKINRTKRQRFHNLDMSNYKTNFHYLFGIKRGGQHCIIYWIKSGYRKAFRVNNLKIGRQIPLKRKSHNLFVNFEDYTFRTTKLVSNEQKFEPGTRRFYLIIRDPFNLFASRFTLQSIEKTKWKARIKHQKSKVDQLRDLWIDHAKNFLNDKTSVVKINYNEWVASEDYRTELANRLGIKPHLYFVNYVPLPGEGSSFDTRKIPGQKMKVFDRWQQLEDQVFSTYIKIFTDEVIELSLRIFGDEFVSRIIDSKIWLSKKL